MKTLRELKIFIDDQIFEDENIEDLVNEYEYDTSNPHHIKLLLDKLDNANSDFHQIVTNALIDINKQTSTLSKDAIKSVYMSLKNRDENPRGEFDKNGRFYIIDSDLLNVRSPSIAYPYSQMNAARTAKFVKLLVNKYKCNTIDDLKRVAFQ